MLAGFSFLSRVSKFICEKAKIFDYTEENYVAFEEEEKEKSEDKEAKNEKLDQKGVEMPDIKNKGNVIAKAKKDDKSNSSEMPMI